MSRRLRCRDRLVSHGVTMRVAIITESFPPDVNGVAHCVLRVAELLSSGGHHPLVIAPQPAKTKRDEGASYPFPVVRVPAVPLPGYPGFRLGLPGRRVRAALVGHRAELVHLASPVVLGAHGAAVARRLGLPVVAVAARHSQQRRAHAGPVHGHRDRPARPPDRERLAVGPRRGHAALRAGQAQPRDPGQAGAGR